MRQIEPPIVIVMYAYLSTQRPYVSINDAFLTVARTKCVQYEQMTRAQAYTHLTRAENK